MYDSAIQDYAASTGFDSMPLTIRTVQKNNIFT